jgi:phosphoribosylanthranilate isomerase
MPVRVKICGITSANDALDAVAAGADALGFMFHESSPRYITFEIAADIISRLPPFVARVGVFVNPNASLVHKAIECGIDILQFHGDEPPEFCRQFNHKFIKAFRVRDSGFLESCAHYPDAAWLLDSFVPGQMGGTGQTFNWELAAVAAQKHPFVILAGGLTPKNVATAIQKTHPYAVDVSSGVEVAPGRKSRALMEQFIRAAKSAS